MGKPQEYTVGSLSARRWNGGSQRPLRGWIKWRVGTIGGVSVSFPEDDEMKHLFARIFAHHPKVRGKVLQIEMTRADCYRMILIPTDLSPQERANFFNQLLRMIPQPGKSA